MSITRDKSLSELMSSDPPTIKLKRLRYQNMHSKNMKMKHMIKIVILINILYLGKAIEVSYFLMIINKKEVHNGCRILM